MSGLINSIFGDGGAGERRKAAEDAKVAADDSKRIQSVANDAQLANQNRADTATKVVRRAPRGQRLFEDGGAAGSNQARPSVLA